MKKVEMAYRNAGWIKKEGNGDCCGETKRRPGNMGFQLKNTYRWEWQTGRPI